jgi:glutamate carboxypeptidase
MSLSNLIKPPDVAGLPLPDTHSQMDLLQFLQSQVPFFLEKLKEVVIVNSHTLNPAGIKEVGEKHAAWFEPMGFETQWIRDSSKGYGDHLVLRRKGTSHQKILLIGHLDTVYTTEEEKRNDFSWRVEGPRIYGPGTVDMKGGNLLIWLTLHALREKFPEHFNAVTWVVLYNSREEGGGQKFPEICREEAGSDATAALVFEGSHSRGNEAKVLTCRKGGAKFRVVVEGKASHAGPLQKGANAVVQLAHTLTKIHALTDFEKGTTFNVGTVKGGTEVNRVPHHAEAGIDMRAFTFEESERAKDAIMALQDDIVVRSRAGDVPCKVRVELIHEVPCWPETDSNRVLFSIWNEIAKSFGWSLVSSTAGGRSDANHVGSYVPTLDGLGIAGGHAHCSEHRVDGSKQQEFFYPDSIVPRAALNTLGLKTLIESQA